MDTELQQKPLGTICPSVDVGEEAKLEFVSKCPAGARSHRERVHERRIKQAKEQRDVAEAHMKQAIAARAAHSAQRRLSLDAKIKQLPRPSFLAPKQDANPARADDIHKQDANTTCDDNIHKSLDPLHRSTDGVNLKSLAKQLEEARSEVDAQRMQNDFLQRELVAHRKRDETLTQEMGAVRARAGSIVHKTAVAAAKLQGELDKAALQVTASAAKVRKMQISKQLLTEEMETIKARQESLWKQLDLAREAGAHASEGKRDTHVAEQQLKQVCESDTHATAKCKRAVELADHKATYEADTHATAKCKRAVELADHKATYEADCTLLWEQLSLHQKAIVVLRQESVGRLHETVDQDQHKLEVAEAQETAATNIPRLGETGLDKMVNAALKRFEAHMGAKNDCWRASISPMPQALSPKAPPVLRHPNDDQAKIPLGTLSSTCSVRCATAGAVTRTQPLALQRPSHPRSAAVACSSASGKNTGFRASGGAFEVLEGTEWRVKPPAWVLPTMSSRQSRSISNDTSWMSPISSFVSSTVPQGNDPCSSGKASGRARGATAAQQRRQPPVAKAAAKVQPPPPPPPPPPVAMLAAAAPAPLAAKVAAKAPQPAPAATTPLVAMAANTMDVRRSPSLAAAGHDASILGFDTDHAHRASHGTDHTPGSPSAAANTHRSARLYPSSPTPSKLSLDYAASDEESEDDHGW